MNDLEAGIRKGQRNFLDWIVGHFPGIGLDRRAESFVSHFKEFIPLRSRVLDIGGRWGFYAEPLQRLRNCDVTVLDVEEPKFSKVSVVTYGGERMPFPDGSFDVSLLVTVLHHVKVPEAVLAEAKRVTRGAVIVVEDLYQSAVGRLWTIVRDSLYNLEFFGHPRNFRTKAGWLDCFRNLGFEVAAEKEMVTSLLGLRILNGCFVLRTTNGKEPSF